MMKTFDKVPEWAAWLAQDEDGTWHPQGAGRGWYENEVGRILRRGQTEPPADWGPR